RKAACARGPRAAPRMRGLAGRRGRTRAPPSPGAHPPSPDLPGQARAAGRTLCSGGGAMDRKAQQARARRQARVGKVVWGALFLGLGVLFSLEDMGRVDLGETPKSELVPANAVDGNEKTRWSSAFRERQWLTVDLGGVEPVRRLRLHWEDAYAKEYEIQVSDDGVEWKTVRTATSTGGIEEYEIDATGRYVRLLGTARATPYGISLW